MSDMKDRMIEAYERGWCSYEGSYDYVREQYADAADLARKREKENPPESPSEPQPEPQVTPEIQERQRRADMDRYGHSAAWREERGESDDAQA